MPENDSVNGLIFAIRLNCDGSGTELSWPEIARWTPEQGPIWVHLDRTSDAAAQWLRDESGLTEATVDALLNVETRPRVFRGKRGTIAILRGVNLNPKASAEDMVDLRLWSEGQRLISLRSNPVQTARDLRAQLLETRDGAATISELFEGLVARLGQRIAPTIGALRQQLGKVEAQADKRNALTREALMDIRNKTTSLRRYLAPQRLALKDLHAAPPDWADESWGPTMREAGDTLAYYVEELDTVRSQAIVIKDDVASQQADETNRTLYVLAVISAVFLPLAFLTGLLGINIGGMPGVESNSAFWIFCGILGVVGILEIIIFKALKWI